LSIYGIEVRFRLPSLEARKAPIKLLIVDRAEKVPTEN
jgi:hypothetical protein